MKRGRRPRAHLAEVGDVLVESPAHLLSEVDLLLGDRFFRPDESGTGPASGLNRLSDGLSGSMRARDQCVTLSALPQRCGKSTHVSVSDPQVCVP